MNRFAVLPAAGLFALGLATAAARAAGPDITVGAIFALTGPNASLGIPDQKAVQLLPKEIAGHKVKLILLDDTSDPSTAVRNAVKLITEDKVDIIFGPSNTPAGVAVSAVTNERKVPEVVMSPVDASGDKAAWLFTVPQPSSVWITPTVKDMVKRGVKRVAFIGFGDPWGDLCLNALKKAAPEYGLTIVAEERYDRTDTSISGQILKILAAKPDAVFVGGSGSPGALPHIALAGRNYAGLQYNTPGVFSKEFVRVGGKAVEGVMATTGPVGAMDQLPDSNPIKKVAFRFRELYDAANGPGTANGLSAYAYDATLLFTDAATRAVAKAQPGTPEFRTSLRDEFYNIHELVGTHGVYNFKPGSPYGVDERAAVLMRIENGDWKLVN